MARPGVPNKDGTATVNPAATSRSPNPTTSGVMPGASGSSTTPGPEPLRYTGWVRPAAAKGRAAHPARTSEGVVVMAAACQAGLAAPAPAPGRDERASPPY